MPALRVPGAVLTAFLFLGTWLACAPEDGEQGGGSTSAGAAAGQVLFGEPLALGGGSARTFVEIDAEGHPTRLGVAFGESMLQSLPTEPDGTMPCFDADGDGSLDESAECMLGVQRDLELPAGTPASVPFRWVGLNWNPEGHPAPAPPVYGVPHFDFHFYLPGPEAIAAIRPGPCGFMVDCEVFEHGRAPIPEPYMPVDYIEVGAVAAGEGNHLLDGTSPELGDPPQDFTHTFIYGAHDGHIIFYEPMIAEAFLAGRPDECHPIKQPKAWEVAGDYPTEYCMRYLPAERVYEVSLERFVSREAA
ncbi:MAG: hypothetical protein JSV95_01105 [Gemmatimonadota bacterium]|nr:MAG: hypothetical protein JSV95_01105 [Gemmatimonadota bacterium]